MKSLDCRSSKIAELDVSGHTALEELICYGNQLTSLNVSVCTALTKLECYGNKLTKLDTGSCAALREIVCHGNRLPVLDMSANSKLSKLACSSQSITVPCLFDGSMYTVDLTRLMEKSQLQHILSFDLGSFDAATGLWTSDTLPIRVFYQYNTQLLSEEKSMKVFPNLELHEHSWQYTAMDGAIMAACTNADCPKSDGGRMTITAPQGVLTEGDGNSKTASVSGAFLTGIQNPTDASILYSFSEYAGAPYTEISVLPEKAGFYRASLSVTDGENTCTAFVEYEILPKPSALPQTGDRTHPEWWMAGMLVSLMGAFALMRRRTKA